MSIPGVLALATAAAAAVGSASPSLHLRPCVLQSSLGARCGTLAVPEDRRRPGGRAIRVFVAVLPAFGAGPHKEPIVWLSGGPGGAAASDDAGVASSTFAAANRTRDIVLVDQRGVGRSQPLVCPRPPLLGTATDALAFARACVKRLGHDPRLYTTDAAMDDVDAVRQALGYDRIVLVGGSYGASAAQVYLARHGSHVAAAVLDGATLLDTPIWERMPVSVQGAFDALADRCAGDATRSSAYGDVRAALVAVTEQVRAHPIQIPLSNGSFSLGVSQLQDTVRAVLRAPSEAARLPAMLHLAAVGDPSALVAAARGGIPVSIDAARKLMYWAIRCGDGWSRDDPRAIERLSGRSLFVESALRDAQTQALICRLLGKRLPAPDTGVVPRRRVPLLFLVGGMDPQDPLANVAHARRSLPNAQLLVVPGAGHGSIQYGCLAAVATRFLTSHRLSAGDRACAAAVRPPPFTGASSR